MSLFMDMMCYLFKTLWILIMSVCFVCVFISMMSFADATHSAQINITYSSTNLTVGEGGNAILACSVFGDPRPAVVWSHAQHSSRPDVECPIEAFSTAGGCTTDDVVILRNITRLCAGVYNCLSYNDIGSNAVHDINVAVHFSPDISVPSAEVSQVEGRDAILECSIASVPLTVTSWRRNGRKLESSEKYHMLSYPDNDFTVTLVLRIKSLKESDEGEYKCMASNYMGKITKEVHLSVALPPHIQAVQSSYTAALKASVTLQCLIQSTPIRSYAWQKDGYDIVASEKYKMYVDYIDKRQINSSLTISNIESSDSGKYICVVINPADIARDTVSLEVVLPVEISIPVKAVNGIYKKEAALECHISGSPINSVYWTGPGGTNLSRSDKYSVNMYNEGLTEITMVLIISNLDHNDKGEYHCVATNDVQVSKAAIVLQVKLDLPFCEKLSDDIPMCKHMPYNITKFPNHMGHATTTEASEDVSRFWPVVKSKCSFQLRPFLCSMYFPVCTSYGKSLLPCRSLCYRGKRGCLDVLTAFNMDWPDEFNCRNLPSTNCYDTKDKTAKKIATTTPVPSICEEITAITPMCLIDISYKNTRFPNTFGHETALEAHADMAQYWPLLEKGCASEIRPLLCSLYVPKCTDDGTEWLPCKQLCQRAKEGCITVMKQYNYPWPDKLDCNKLPDNHCVYLEEEGEICEDLKVDVCHMLPYRKSKFPNHNGDASQQEAAEHIQQFQPIIEMDCAPEFEALICATYLPKCTNAGRILKPCQALCDRAKAGCELLAFQYGFTWPEALSCEDLPQSGDCFTLEFPTSKPKIECEEIREPICYNLPYNATGYPNNLNHLNQIDAAIELQQFLPLIQVECAPELQIFLCSLYMPACEGTGEIIKPCKKLCEKSRVGCEPLMNKFGFEWPELLYCDWLPEEGNCISTRDEHICELINIPFCSEMPYNFTRYPNILLHDSQQDAEKDLLKFLPLVSAHCAQELGSFLCSVYTPQCLTNGEVVPPCRQFCEEIKTSCQTTVETIGFEWPPELSCNNFPTEGQCFREETKVEEKCEHIHISICEDLPYNLTKYPNMLYHGNQDEARLDLQQFIPFIEIECAKELKPFLCSMYVPQCLQEGGAITKPCKELCHKSRLGCETFMNRMGMEWPEILSCEFLPDNDDCFNTNAMDKTEIATCEDLIVDICEFLPYNKTRFPNRLSHATQEEAKLQFETYVDAIESQCAENFEHFLCSAYFPECTLKGNEIKPCRDSCQRTRNLCERVLQKLGLEWPASLQCDIMPHNNCSNLTEINERRCQPIKISSCMDLPYNKTELPNILSHKTQEEVDNEMGVYTSLIKTGCSPALVPFLCTMHLPQCSSDGNFTMPCRPVCEKVKESCEPSMQEIGLSWPKSFQCDQLPVDDDCFSIISPEKEQCETISLSMCDDLPYNETKFPNFFHHSNEEEAKEGMNSFRGLLQTDCSQLLKPLLCTLHFPRCSLYHNITQPCKTICKEVKKDCTVKLRKLGYTWPDILTCDDLSDTDECFDIDISDVMTEPKCEGIRTPLCEGLSYNQTMFPNFLNHNTQEEAGLELQQFYPLINVNCADDLQSFLCSMFIPKCSTNGTLLKPCKAFCELSRSGCETFMNRIGMEWPSKLECEALPEGDNCFITQKKDDNICEVLRIPECLNMTYSETLLPNAFSHKTQEEVQIQLNSFAPLLQAGCSASLQPFLCALLLPNCSHGGNITRPCQSLCKAAKRNCQREIEEISFLWPKKYDCDDLPQDESCFDLQLYDEAQCEDITLSICQNLPYNQTQFPNLLDHTTQKEAENAISILLKLVESNCSSMLQPFLCSMYVPRCSVEGNITKPCRSLCLSASEGCDRTLARLGISSEVFTCDGLTESDGCFHIEEHKSPKCETITTPMCKEITYNKTSFPNFLSHKSQEEATEDLDKFLKIRDTVCSPILKHFLCAMYVPKCSSSGNITKPCKQLCLTAKSRCEETLEKSGISWPKNLSCEDLPQNDVCFDVEPEELPVRTCEAINIRKCQHFGYNSTRFPNEKAQTQNDAYVKLSKYIPLSYFDCSTHLMPFLCSLYIPPCNKSGDGYVRPCRRLCKAAKRGCDTLMSKFGYKWEDDLLCENFHDDDDCFSHGVKKTEIASHCGIGTCHSKGENGKCDAECDHSRCDFDNMECTFGILPYTRCTPMKNGVSCDKLFANGECDQECNNEYCLFDGFDCQGRKRKCSPLYETYCKIHFGDKECDLGCSPAYCGFDGGDCILSPLYLRGQLVLTFDLQSKEVESKSSEILRMLALVTHTVIFIDRDGDEKQRIEAVTKSKQGFQRIGADTMDKSKLNMRSKVYFKADFGSCMQEFASMECFRSVNILGEYLAMVLRAGTVDNATLPILNIEYENT